MISQSKQIQDASKLSAALKGTGINSPNPSVSRLINQLYSGEKNFPMMAGDWLFSLDAVATVGRGMFGDGWNATEFDTLHWPVAPLRTYADRLRLERRRIEVLTQVPVSLASLNLGPVESAQEFQAKKETDLKKIDDALLAPAGIVNLLQTQWTKNQEAQARLKKAAKWLGDKCREGVIKTGYGSVPHLPILLGNPCLWSCADDITHWAHDGTVEIYSSNGSKSRCKAFVSRADLEREITTLAHSEASVPKADLSRLAPDLQLAVRLAIKLQLFGAEVKIPSGKLEDQVIAAAKDEGRDIAPGRVKEIVRLMRFTDEAKSNAGRKGSPAKN